MVPYCLLFFREREEERPSRDFFADERVKECPAAFVIIKYNTLQRLLCHCLRGIAYTLKNGFTPHLFELPWWKRPTGRPRTLCI